MSDTPIFDGLTPDEADPIVVDFSDMPVVSLDDHPNAGPTEADMNGDQAGGLQL